MTNGRRCQIGSKSLVPRRSAHDYIDKEDMPVVMENDFFVAPTDTEKFLPFYTGAPQTDNRAQVFGGKT